MKFKELEITDLAKQQIAKHLKKWNCKAGAKLVALPNGIGIIAQYVNSENEVEYCCFTEYGKTISNYVFDTFEKAILEVTFRVHNMDIINAGLRVLSV